jgi:hypothetical protein
MYNAPLLPLLEVPVLITTNPLTPFVPALAVCRSSLPDEVAVPYPVTSEILPPVGGWVSWCVGVCE